MIGGIINPYNPDEEISFTDGYIKFPEFRGTASIANTASYLRLWDSGLNRWVQIQSIGGILTVV
jgi:hypothetical protein